MSAPGVEVRPIVQATGAVTFNEVFLDGAVLPPEAAIGPPGAGWSVALTTLMNERLAVGPDQIPFAALRDEASARGAWRTRTSPRRSGPSAPGGASSSSSATACCER